MRHPRMHEVCGTANPAVTDCLHSLKEADHERETAAATSDLPILLNA